MRRVRSLSSFGALLLLVLVACGPAAGSGASSAGSTAQTAPAAPQRTLVVGIRGEPPSLATKALTPFSPALRGPAPLFNAKLDGVDDREVPYAYLAEALPELNTDSWQVFADGRMETTYRLKPDLRWHDGASMTADDFAFAWRVYSAPQFGLSTTPPIGLLEDVRAPDPRTVILQWRQPYADAAVLNDEFQPLPRHLLEERFRDLDPIAFTNLPFWGAEYVGLGPYRLERWEPGAFIEGRAFDGHALGRPKIDRVRVVFIADPNSALANLLAGEVHYVSELVLADDSSVTLEREWAPTRGGTVLYAPVSLRVTVVQLRPEIADPPALLDVRVRRAFAHGIDGPTANEVINSGRGVLTSTLTSPRVDFYPEIDRVIAKYPHDPRRTQQLMEDAGFTRAANGFFVGRDGPLQVGVWSSSGAKNDQENEVIVDSLRKAGIDASRRVFSAAQLSDAEARTLIPGLSTRGQPAKPLSHYTSGQIPRAENRWRGENRGAWSSPAYDRVFDAYAGSLERSERIRHTAELERLFTADLPGIPHWYNPTLTAHVAALQGPKARQTPESGSGSTIQRIWEWEWRG